MSAHEPLVTTQRSKLRRRPDRGSTDRRVIDAILDEALVCHVGFLDEGEPVVIPSSPWRIGGWLYLHGAVNSRLIRHVASGAPVCISVALVDGLVLARSAMRHSTNYRSTVLFGRGELVEAAADKTAALMRLIDKMSPGRSGAVRPPDAKELAATGVVRVAIVEGSAKVRAAPPTEVEKDKPWTVWTGTVPVALLAGSPLAAMEETDGAPPGVPSWLAKDWPLQTT
ncbi:MAG: pyridoxamine 5'-phosphate oxidase family protein [Xanthobacteraceae bacterium]|nr:MAG: pyridoxamine 5'-phosphate oxidase family protein [Xanthobacteraceae bacterium]